MQDTGCTMQDRNGSDSGYLVPMPHSHICARFPAAGLGLRCSVSGPPSCILHPVSCILHLAYPVCGFSKREPGIPPYCPTALLPDCPAASRVPGTWDPIPGTESYYPSLVTPSLRHSVLHPTPVGRSLERVRPWMRWEPPPSTVGP